MKLLRFSLGLVLRGLYAVLVIKFAHMAIALQSSVAAFWPPVFVGVLVLMAGALLAALLFDRRFSAGMRG